MVAVYELVIIDHYTCRAFTRNKVISSGCIRSWCIHIRQEFADGKLDRIIGTAECSHDAFLLKRILLFLHLMVGGLALLWCSRKKGTVLPIRMCCQHGIRVKPVTLNHFTKVLPVGRTGRPVHQLMGRKRTRIQHVNKSVVRSIISCHGIELIRRHVTGDRDHHSGSRICRGMAVGGIDASLVMDIAVNPCKELCQNAVQVIYQHGSAHHLVCLSAVITKMPCNKTAFVLDIVPLSLRQLRIFLCCFRCADRLF